VIEGTGRSIFIGAQHSIALARERARDSTLTAEPAHLRSSRARAVVTVIVPWVAPSLQ
jgi:hypothetical protein